MSVTAATDRQIAEARAALEASMHNIGSHLDSTLKSRAQNLHANNAAVDKQIADLQNSTRLLAKETDKLKKIADDAGRKLKEVGNVQNWAEVMEREFLILEETVRLADLSEEEDYGPCRVCGQRVDESGDELLWCRGCEGEFHTSCVGLEGVPMGEWFCAECEQQGTYLQSVKTAEDGHTAVNGGDAEMGGMEGEKGKGKERAVMEVDGEEGSSTTATADGSYPYHSSISIGE
jgi:hypothetical protein